jgi:hypothetical protein
MPALSACMSVELCHQQSSLRLQVQCRGLQLAMAECLPCDVRVMGRICSLSQFEGTDVSHLIIYKHDDGVTVPNSLRCACAHKSA